LLSATALQWEDIDTREIPGWFDKAKFGIFIHWGIYSVPAYAPKRSEVDTTGLAYSEWYGWQVKQKFPPYYDFHKRTYGENFTYEDFAGQWRAELFDPDEWAKLFRRAGARYTVLVAKHHDAFCLWPSYYSWNWNSMDIGPKRDIVKEYLDAAEAHGLRRGLYYSLLEWSHPVMQVSDPDNADIPKYAIEKMIPQMKELVEAYQPSILFTDGEWSYTSEQWHSRDFISWLFEQSSVKDEIVINDRWGKDTRGVHGGYLSCEYGEVNSAALDEQEAQSNLGKRKWEECRSIGASFGFNRNEDSEDYLSEKELVHLLADVVSRGGNLCLNVGPNADGTISPMIQERLIQLGDWLEVNGRAIYESSPAAVDGLPETAVSTQRDGHLYLMFKRYPKEAVHIRYPGITRNSEMTLLGYAGRIEHSVKEGEATFEAPCLSIDELPCKHVYTFEIRLG